MYMPIGPRIRAGVWVNIETHVKEAIRENMDMKMLLPLVEAFSESLFLPTRAKLQQVYSPIIWLTR